MRKIGDRTHLSIDRTKNRTLIRICLLATLLILVLAGTWVFFSLGPGWLYPRDVSVGELYERPAFHVGQKVNTVGYLVKHAAPHFGDDYILCEGDPRNMYFAVNPCIAVVGSSSTIDRYISLVFNGTNYEVAPSPCSFAVPCRVVVTGVFVDRGTVSDASQYVIEASSCTWHG